MVSGLLTFNLFSSRVKRFFLFLLTSETDYLRGKYVKHVVRFTYHGFKYSRCKVFLIQTVPSWPWGNQELNMELLTLWHVFPECTIDFTLWYIVSSISAWARKGFSSGSFLTSSRQCELCSIQHPMWILCHSAFMIPFMIPYCDTIF